MRIIKDNIKIELEDEGEIDTFWNIIAFALDFHEKCQREGKPCMTERELNMAKKLAEITEKRW